MPDEREDRDEPLMPAPEAEMDMDADQDPDADPDMQRHGNPPE